MTMKRDLSPLLSVIILTKDEELNLAYCLESLRGLDAEIFVVDSGSSDRTIAIAREFGASVHFRAFDNYARQFNWAIDNLPISGQWCMRMDADERLLPALVDEMRTTLPNSKNEVNGYVLNRQMHFWGRWIRHGGYYPMWMVRIWRTGFGRCEDRWMDEHIVIREGAVERLRNDFVDDNHKDLTFWTAKHNGYATREVMDRMNLSSSAQKGRLADRESSSRRKLKQNIYCNLPLFIRPFIYWFYRYFIRLGFLDGMTGFIFHFLHGFWYQFLIDAKIYEAVRVRKMAAKSDELMADKGSA